MLFKNKELSVISVQEAHILWRLLTDRYIIIDHINQLKNFTHDKDFALYLGHLVKGYKHDVKILLEKLDEFSIPGPTPNVREQNAIGNSEIVKDRKTAEIIFGYMRLDLSLKLYSLIDARDNREIRILLVDFLKKSMDRLDNLIKYMKMKNWIAQPPLYRYSTKGSERVACNEVFLLYDHLLYRYFNIRQTKYFEAFASDIDFRAILEIGVNILKKQIDEIEDRLLYYGVTLPKPFSETTPGNVDTEMISDRYMFTAILRGMQDAISLHGIAIVEVIVSDNLRKFFKKLLFDELSYVDKMIIYGREKGWVYPSPIYHG